VIDLETAIIIAATLASTIVGAVVGYFLGERRERNRLRRQIALKLLPEKQLALKDAYYVLVDLLLLLGIAAPESAG
jgi:membrane protein DedA with SNARE-associated domain